MRVMKEMQPLCCISGESEQYSPEWATEGGMVAVAGVLQKWTNLGKGWRWRWFLLRDGVLSYADAGNLNNISMTPNDVRFIGPPIAAITTTTSRRHRGHNKTDAIVHLKISSFRESKSDSRRFYILTATKTVHLRSVSKRDTEAWLSALSSSTTTTTTRRSLVFPASDDHELCVVSTDRLKRRLVEEGVADRVVKDCEQIMVSEFHQIHSRLYQQRSNLLQTLTHFMEGSNLDGEASGLSIGPGKYSECSTTTESCDETERQQVENEEDDDDEVSFYDSREYFSNTNHNSTSCECDDVERRKKLPEAAEKEKGVSLWTMIKDNVGKDLTRVCLPVYFNEPISSLQKCCEDLEYSFLLDRAYESGNSLQRALNVAAFAVSAYASSEGRHCKPFNPLLGETYEADFPDRGIRFFSEKVSHHPTLIACHCEGRGWKFWADTNLRTKFWGRSIQVDPVGDLSVEFDDGEVFQWSKVTTTIYNLILGKVYCDHHGIMHIRGNRNFSCKLKFKEQSILDRNPRQVNGIVEDGTSGTKLATLFGKWDDSMYYYDNNDHKEASLLWKRTKPPLNLTRYNLTSFAITLNELTPGLKEKLPLTDSRLRPDQRHLENGEYDKANAEKQRLEMRQRMSRKLQENGWKPRWFTREDENGAFRYTGGYWEARDQGKFENCPNIFGEFDQGSTEAVVL